MVGAKIKSEKKVDIGSLSTIASANVEVTSALPAGDNNIGNVDVHISSVTECPVSIVSGSIVGVSIVEKVSVVTTIGTVDLVSQVASIGNVDYVSQIASLGNVDYISQIVSIGNINALSVVQSVAHVSVIQSVALVSVVTSIGTINLVSAVTSIGTVNLVSQVASIGNINALSVVQSVAHVSVIQSIAHLSAIASINHLSVLASGNVDVAAALPAGTNNIGNVDVNLSTVQATASWSAVTLTASADQTLLSVNGATTITIRYIEYANLGTSTILVQVKWGAAGTPRFIRVLAGDGGMINANLIGGYWECADAGSIFVANMNDDAGSVAITVGYSLAE